MIPCPPPQPPAKTGLTRQRVKDHFLGHGYKRKPTSDHLYRVVPRTDIPGAATVYRIEVTSHMARKMVRVDHTDKTTSWVRVRSGYLKDLWIWNNQLFGMKR